MSTVWHDLAQGDKPTKCCNRTPAELPLGDGRTTDSKRWTCDGKYEPAVYAHTVYPHPSDHYDEPPTLDDAVRYHLARTIAMYPVGHLPNAGEQMREWMDRITLMLAERHTACLMVAIHKGTTGQDAIAFAHAYSCSEDGEMIYDLAVEYGVALDRIKPYPLRSAIPSAGG